MKEIGVPVINTNGYYSISNLGRIKNKNNLIIKTWYNQFGYERVRLSVKGVKKSWYVHRLVAMHFIPNPTNLPQVNHKDENKTNNKLENLEGCTGSYNVRYGSCQDRRIKKRFKK